MKPKRAFTLIELLVVIAIIALLVSILMPALGRAKELAKQVQCAAHISGVGKSMAVYQADNKEMNPSVYGTDRADDAVSLFNGYYIPGQPMWNDYGQCMSKANATYIGINGTWNYPTVGGCLFLLVKYTDVTPEVFLCPSADWAKELTLDMARNGDTGEGWVQIVGNPQLSSWQDCYDFCTMSTWTYSYNDPDHELLDSSAGSQLAVLADLTPACSDPSSSAPWNNNLVREKATSMQAYAWYGACFLPTNQPDPNRYGDGHQLTKQERPSTPPFNPDWTSDNQNKWPGNSFNHGTEVQNVLFADSHVKKSNTPCVGVDKDNIYSHWGGSGLSNINDLKQIGSWYRGSASERNDSYLVN